ncbi:ERI1 exoribonuclease 2-like [Micractinium conductrix]|uniref:ERI1 exoribonuclease 2-like n=1 Tax=Micractinium conductrix TaxID=554055 RepID=A0A2P6VIJ7_9CHLO|nr:ERI1 exoribonuclease 2-like [Micractinium conductrix]|eukprot:PSC73911.1 ERI1 exoribonuclease 2-like [Micractinium conductrix]
MEDSAAGQDQPQQQLPPAGGSGAEEQAAAGGSGAEEEQAPAGGGGAGEEPAPAEAALAAAAAAAEPAPKKRRLKQLFDYLLVLDIESTCDRDKSKQPSPQEIIELSCVVVDTAALQVGAGFQRYVRPDQHPQLTDFCTELTGITQGQVDAGVPLRAALADLDGWLRQQGLLGKGKTFAPATWRDWDLKVMLAGETRWRGITQPKYLSRWVDLSAVWFKHSKQRGNLAASVAAAGLTWEGRAHSALDDARNTARLAIKILQGGVILGLTGSFGNLDASGRFRQGTLLGMARGGKADGGGGASGGGGGGGGRGGGGATAAGLRKKQITDAAGAWTGICFCGAKAKKRTVKRPGPNNGRDFWSCSKFTMTGGAGCDLFKFADEVRAPADLLKESAKSGRWGR